MLQVKATIDGVACSAVLAMDQKAYRPVPGLTWYDDRGRPVKTWIGHAVLTHEGGEFESGLRAVHIVRVRAGALLPSWVLLWNGNIDDRRASFRVADPAVVTDSGACTIPLDHIDERRLVDGTFLAIPVAPAPVLASPAGDALLEEVGLKRGEQLGLLADVAQRMHPWVDEEANTESQGSPGSCRIVRTEAMLVQALAPGDGMPWPAWLVGAVQALTENALQDGRRRLHYFRVQGDGQLVPFVRNVHAPQATIDDDNGLDDGGMLVSTADASVLVDGALVPVVHSAGEQHFFRLMNHDDAFAATGDPLFWLVGQGLLQWAACSDIASKPLAKDKNGNQRRAWVPFAAAHHARRFRQCLADTPARDAAAGRADCTSIVAAWAAKEAARKTERVLPSGVFHVLSENTESSRGHHGATWIAFQAAIECMAADEAQRAAKAGALSGPEAVVEDVADLAELAAWAEAGLLDAVALRVGHAPADVGPWGVGASGCPAYDVATLVTLQLKAPAKVGDWWHSSTGGGYSGTYVWAYEAWLRRQRTAPADANAEQRLEAVAAFHAKAHGLEPHDSAFPDLLATALLTAASFPGLPVAP